MSTWPEPAIFTLGCACAHHEGDNRHQHTRMVISNGLCFLCARGVRIRICVHIDNVCYAYHNLINKQNMLRKACMRVKHWYLWLPLLLDVSLQHSAVLQGLSRYDAISKITKSMHYDNLGKCGHLIFNGPVLLAATQACASICTFPLSFAGANSRPACPCSCNVAPQKEYCL